VNDGGDDGLDDAEAPREATLTISTPASPTIYRSNRLSI
jgi:hypothetical protein